MRVTLLHGFHLTARERAVLRHMASRGIYHARSGRTVYTLAREDTDEGRALWGENAWAATVRRRESNTRGELLDRERKYVVRLT